MLKPGDLVTINGLGVALFQLRVKTDQGSELGGRVNDGDAAIVLDVLVRDDKIAMDALVLCNGVIGFCFPDLLKRVKCSKF